MNIKLKRDSRLPLNFSIAQDKFMKVNAVFGLVKFGSVSLKNLIQELKQVPGENDKVKTKETMVNKVNTCKC